jgi:nucleotide-binding universal stress UspA family protein
MYEKLLVGYDGSAGARAALSQAIALGQVTGAEIWALWVRETIPHFAEVVGEITAEEEAAQKYLVKLKAEVERLESSQNVEIHFHSQPGYPAEKLLRYAMEGAFDLIVIGSNGHSGLWGRLLGHTTDRVSEHAPCSVLIVRPQPPPAEMGYGEVTRQ